MPAVRKCMLCKLSFPIRELERVGKGYLCWDRMECWKQLRESREITNKN